MNTPWIQETRNGFEIAEEEINRLEASPAQGEQSSMVQSDMKAWAVKKGIWLSEHYNLKMVSVIVKISKKRLLKVFFQTNLSL